MSNRTGRKTKYDKSVHDDWAMNLAMEGLIDKEIAKKMGIARSTLNLWKIEHNSFSDALKIGKEPANAKVINSLYKLALGYVDKQKKVIIEMDKEGNSKPARIETTDIVVQPNMGAIAFWLKNRLPEDWKDQKQVDVTGNAFESLLMMAIEEDEAEETEESTQKLEE